MWKNFTFMWKNFTFSEIVVIITQIWKDLNWFDLISLNLLLSSYLFVSYSSFFIRFSMNISLWSFLHWWAQTSDHSPTYRVLYAVHWSASVWSLGFRRWWAQVDSNHRPRAYQARALTTWAMSPFSFRCISPSCHPLCRSPDWWRWWRDTPKTKWAHSSGG